MDLNHILISAPYCFGDQPLELTGLSKINFIFAPNGSGKTTISNALAAQPEDSEDRKIWSTAPTSLSIRVFNEEYKSRVLTDHVNGIFTMGPESEEVNTRIGELESSIRVRVQNRRDWIDSIGSQSVPNSLLGIIEKERQIARKSIFEKHKEVPKPAAEIIFKGFRNNKDQFFQETIKRFEVKTTEAVEFTWESLETRASSLVGSIGERSPIPTVSMTSLISMEQIRDVAQPISHGGGGSLTELIEHLHNQDWVNEGRKYVEETNGSCPFCQQTLPENFEDELGEYFSSGFDEILQRALSIRQSVTANSEELERELSAVESAIQRDSGIDQHPIIDEISNVRTAMNLLRNQVDDKSMHPTKAIQVSDVQSSVSLLTKLVNTENTKIAAHNKLVNDSVAERKKLIEDGWKLFLSQKDVKNAVRRFKGVKSTNGAKIQELRNKISQSETDDKTDSHTINSLRSSISNTVEVADRINKTLSLLGFRRFKLSVVDSITGGYRIVREDGTSAFATLSEGEKSFICFAYFWESLSATTSSGTDIEDVVAVVDDPISSLDSDSLFLVAAYIRDAAQMTISGSSNIRQLIVLTHNTQFHNEAAYSNNARSKSNCHYYRLVKGSDGSTFVEDDSNQNKIRGTYSLLWDSVVEAARSADESDLVRAGIFNIVRRIVERYFKTLGCIKEYQHLQNLSPIQGRIIAMFDIWANAGSHTVFDDIDQTSDLCSTRQFLKLFQRYFDIQGQKPHFDMMLAASGGEDLLEPGQLFGYQLTPNPVRVSNT